MLPLKVVFLWHQHQPDYRMDDVFLMPWTRLHGIKDYFDLPEVLYEFPAIKQTVNMVPSLSKQLYEYYTGKYRDRVQILTQKNASLLDEKEKSEILNTFFRCQVENMILPYQRFRELFEKSKDKNDALYNFQTQDWLDLQVWYNLTWFGYYSRQSSLIKRLFEKGKNFTEEEKTLLLQKQLQILSNIDTQLISLKGIGQLEISCTPMYHPIMPLLCDMRAALESMPYLKLPEQIFKFPQDASLQLEKGIDYFKSIFKDTPNGIWPSEGSLSNVVLDLMIEKNIKWTASDERLLSESLGDNFIPTEKFFPRKYSNKNGSIAVFFRDHFLSDRIGFVYSQWNPQDAANDFCHHLRNIRNEIIRVHGEEALNHAAVSVILDGENCWEFYKENGVPFLRALYSNLSQSNEFTTVTFSEAIADEHLEYLKPIHNIKAGSWINANFAIWIGDKDDQRAWEMLTNARLALEKAKSNISEEKYNEALEEALIAEGSDWFWWYGPEHQAENKDEFDILFRHHIENIYKIIGYEVPKEVYLPIFEQSYVPQIQNPESFIYPNINGLVNDFIGWEKAGIYNTKSAMSAMHQIGELFEKVYFGRSENDLFFRIILSKKLENSDSIKLFLVNNGSLNVEFSKNNIICNSNRFDLKISNLECIDIQIMKIDFNTDIEIVLTSSCQGADISYPRNGRLSLNLK